MPLFRVQSPHSQRRGGVSPPSPSILYSLSSLLALSPLALAEPTPTPAPAPSTRFTTTRLVGEENPKRMLTIYAGAMSAGRPDIVRSSYHPETPDQRTVVDAYAHLATAVATLRTAATDKFGPDGFDNIGFAKMFADQVKTLQNIHVIVDGDRAYAFTDQKDTKPDLRLIRLKPGGWKISGTSFSNPTRTAARIEAQATAYEELAAEITAGKYPLATDARVAGRTKVAEAMTAVEEKLKSSTQPTPPSDVAGASRPRTQDTQPPQPAAEPSDTKKP